MRPQLSSKDKQIYLRDILGCIEDIHSFIGDKSFEDYQADRLTSAAVERKMQIISEAAFRLGTEADVLCPGPDWRGARGMGNVLRHEYNRVSDQIIWDAVKDKLPSMREAILKALGDS
jgi:uncharacterized protein with HEPN domain